MFTSLHWHLPANSFAFSRWHEKAFAIPCMHLVLVRYSFIHLLIHSTLSCHVASTVLDTSSRKWLTAIDTHSRRLYKGQQKHKGKFLLSYALGGSREGKGFLEEMMCLLGLEGWAGRKSMDRERKNNSFRDGNSVNGDGERPEHVSIILLPGANVLEWGKVVETRIRAKQV